MLDDEVTQVRVKVKFPGEEARFLLVTEEGFDLVCYDHASLIPSLDDAFVLMDDLGGVWPTATLSAIEEGWSGDWPEGVSMAHAAFWRH